MKEKKENSVFVFFFYERTWTYCVEIWNASGRKTVCDFLCGHYSTDRMTIAQWFGDRHDVRYDILRFERPIMCANTTESHLHFIGDDHSASITNNSVENSHY